VLNDATHQLRPYEIQAGHTDRVMAEAIGDLAIRLRDRRPFEVLERAPRWLAPRLPEQPRLKSVLATAGKIHDHLLGAQTRGALRRCADQLSAIDVDRLRVKPVVRVTGEFWAQTTEGDGNFRMFEFLEREGAEVRVEPLGTWILYLLWHARAKQRRRHDLGVDRPPLRQRSDRLAHEARYRRTLGLLWLGEALYGQHYRRVAAALGGLGHALPDMNELAALAGPYYHPLADGGEGHLEVAKTLHASRHRTAHMVLSLKPFGCLPSTQSDGVQSAVMPELGETIFLPVETGGEGAIHAYSRVQMALGDARASAQTEFDAALARTKRPLAAIRAHVEAHPELRRPFYPVPSRPGVIGTAANFALHVADRMRH
jgi:hypothetical protein